MFEKANTTNSIEWIPKNEAHRSKYTDIGVIQYIKWKPMVMAKTNLKQNNMRKKHTAHTHMHKVM